MSLFVAGAVFGDVGVSVSLLLSGAALVKIWEISEAQNDAFFHTNCVVEVGK